MNIKHFFFLLLLLNLNVYLNISLSKHAFSCCHGMQLPTMTLFYHYTIFTDYLRQIKSISLGLKCGVSI